MLKRLINKIMKIKYVDSEGVERYETYKEWQERITKEVREITEDVDKYIEESRKEREELLKEHKEFLNNSNRFIEYMEKEYK